MNYPAFIAQDDMAFLDIVYKALNSSKKTTLNFINQPTYQKSSAEYSVDIVDNHGLP